MSEYGFRSQNRSHFLTLRSIFLSLSLLRMVACESPCYWMSRKKVKAHTLAQSLQLIVGIPIGVALIWTAVAYSCDGRRQFCSVASCLQPSY